MQRICSNMQYQICRNMHKQANKKYAVYVHNKVKYPKICKRKYGHICKHTMWHMHKYAQNMHKYAKPNMHKYEFSNMHKYVFNITARLGRKMGFRGLDLRLGYGTTAIMIQQQSAKTMEKQLILISRSLMADFAAVILQCEKTLRHCSDALKSYFAQR